MSKGLSLSCYDCKTGARIAYKAYPTLTDEAACNIINDWVAAAKRKIRHYPNDCFSMNITFNDTGVVEQELFNDYEYQKKYPNLNKIINSPKF